MSASRNCLIVVFAVAMCSSPPSATCLDTMDEPLSEGAVVEFINVPDRSPAPYKMICMIELAGTDHKFHNTSTCTGPVSGEAFGLHHSGVLKSAGGWQYKLDGNKLVIEGWKNPKTGQFHPVRKVTFTSKELPNELMPKVTQPKKKREKEKGRSKTKPT